MASPLEWVFKLFDKLSGPADKMAKSLKGETLATDAATDATDKLEKATDNLGKAQGSAGKESESFRHRLFEWAEIAHRGFEIGERLVDTFLDVGKEAIHAAAGAERSADSIKLLFGESEGSDLLEHLEKVQKFTEFDDSELRMITAELGRAGYAAEQIPDTLPFIADLANRAGGGIGAALASTDVLEKINLSGMLNPRSLRGLSIKFKPFFEDLGRDLGISAKEAQKKATEGGVDPTILINALQRATTRKGGLIGDGAVKSSQSLDSLMHKVGQIKDNLFEGLADGKAIGQFKSFLSNILTSMDPSSEFGKSIIDSLDAIFGDTLKTLFGDLSGPDGIGKFQTKIKDALDYIRDSIPAVQAAFHDFLVVVSATAKAIEAVAHAIGTIAKNDDFNQSKKDAGGIEGAIYHVPFLRMAYRSIAEGNGTTAGAAAQAGLLGAADSSLPQAHDFMWRGGEAIKFDPSDTVIGARGNRGDMLSAAYGNDGAGQGGGRGSASYSVEVNINGAVGEGNGGMSKEDIREAVYSAMEQFATEAA